MILLTVLAYKLKLTHWFWIQILFLIMRVYPLSDYKLKDLKIAELQKKHFKSPSEALYQRNRP